MTVVRHNSLSQLLRAVEEVMQNIQLHLIEPSHSLIYRDRLTQPPRLFGCSRRLRNSDGGKLIIKTWRLATVALLVTRSVPWLCEMVIIAIRLLLLVSVVLDLPLRRSDGRGHVRGRIVRLLLFGLLLPDWRLSRGCSNLQLELLALGFVVISDSSRL
jgi:hypothetical protein